MPYAREYDFKKEFEKDVRSKKRISSNVHKQKGKRGYVGKMLTTVDLLKGKEKREYTKSGKVVKWNMYKQLIPLEELQEYTPEQQKQIVEKWREVHSTKEILNVLGANPGKYYHYLYKLGILEKPNRKKKSKGKRKSRFREATAEDIMDLESFEKLSKPEKFYLLDEYGKVFTAESIGKVWGKSEAAIHNKKYNLKRYMTKKRIPLKRPEPVEPSESIAPIEKEKSEAEQEEKAVAVSPETEKLTLFVDGKPEEKQEEKADTTIQTSSNHSLFKDIELHEVNPDPVKENKAAAEVDELKRMIKEQHEILQGLLNNSGSENQKQQEKADESKTGMSFSFEDEKEGFLLHEDIQRFISVLKKNPDDFRVSINIERMEGN